jgi:hypothetical protein
MDWILYGVLLLVIVLGAYYIFSGWHLSTTGKGKSDAVLGGSVLIIGIMFIIGTFIFANAFVI